LFKRIKCRESASEIAQEAFLKAYLSWESVPDDDDARRGWLWVIAKRTLLDVLRRRQVMTVVDDAERDAVESGETPESALLHHMEVSRLLTQLPPRQAQAVRLTLYGYSNGETAQAMGVSVTAVKNLLYRARLQLS